MVLLFAVTKKHVFNWWGRICTLIGELCGKKGRNTGCQLLVLIACLCNSLLGCLIFRLPDWTLKSFGFIVSFLPSLRGSGDTTQHFDHFWTKFITFLWSFADVNNCRITFSISWTVTIVIFFVETPTLLSREFSQAEVKTEF